MENVIIDAIPIDTYKKCCGIQTQSSDLSDVKVIDYNTDVEPLREQPRASINKSSPCIATLFPSQAELNDEELIRRRHHYETAFDSSVTQTENIDMDKLSNQVLFKANQATGTSNCKITVCEEVEKSLDEIAQNLKDTHLTTKEEGTKVSGTLLLRVYTPSPPSTSPLSTKFYKSNITKPVEYRGQVRSKDLRLPIKSSNRGTAKKKDENETRPKEKDPEHKNRNRKVFKRHKDGTKEIMCYSKGFRRRHHRYSSTESISSSTSAGSMESLRSSTSEGNRSSSTTGSRPSSSLSSHSSDSGSTNAKPTFNVLVQTDKLLNLSPPPETSDNRNNNSQEKKRLPINKNIFELQGSDSGISIQSREGKTIFMVTKELAELPFDVPKLRTRRKDGSKSGSTNSVNIKDLPFDMPKLKRRLRNATDGVITQASSSQSMGDINKQGIHLGILDFVQNCCRNVI